MIRIRILPIFAVLIGAAAWLGPPTAAQAAFEFGVKFTVAGTDPAVFIYDGGPGDTNSAAGKISWSGTVNGVDFSITLTTSNAIPGNPDLAELSIGGLDVINTTGVAKLITIEAAANDYVTGVNNGPMPVIGVVSGTVTQGAGSTSTVKFTAAADTGNTATNFPGSTPPTDLDFPFGSATASVTDSRTLTGGTGFTFTATKPDAFDPSSAYALGGKFEISLSGGATLNALSGKTWVPVPEPASFVLLCAALPVLGFGGWCFRRNRKV
jgi:hypothetical protein